MANVRARKLVTSRIRMYSVTPKAADNDAVLASTALTDAVQVVIAGITHPDVPRNIVVTGVLATGTPDTALTGNVVIHGRDVYNQPISETIALNEGNAVAGKLAFKTVTSITLPAYTDDGDAVKVGFGDVIGFPDRLDGGHILSITIDGVQESVNATITHDPLIVSKCTFDPSTSIPGNKEIEVVYLAK